MVSAGFRKQLWIRLAADPQTVTKTFFWCKFGFGKRFAASWSSHWVGHHWSLYTIHFLLPVTIWSRHGSSIREDDTWKGRFFDFQSAFEALTYQAFLPVQFASNAEQMVDIEFFGCLSCRYKRISFDDCSQLVIVNFQGPAQCSSSSKLSLPLQNLNRHLTMCSLVVPEPNALLLVQVVSATFQPILNKKITRICFLSNISLV